LHRVARPRTRIIVREEEEEETGRSQLACQPGTVWAVKNCCAAAARVWNMDLRTIVALALLFTVAGLRRACMHGFGWIGSTGGSGGGDHTGTSKRQPGRWPLQMQRDPAMRGQRVLNVFACMAAHDT